MVEIDSLLRRGTHALLVSLLAPLVSIVSWLVGAQGVSWGILVFTSIL